MNLACSLKCCSSAALYIVFISILSAHHLLIAAAARELTATTAKDSYVLVLFGDSLTDTGEVAGGVLVHMLFQSYANLRIHAHKSKHLKPQCEKCNVSVQPAQSSGRKLQSH